jgi:hypothetical protein
MRLDGARRLQHFWSVLILTLCSGVATALCRRARGNVMRPPTERGGYSIFGRWDVLVIFSIPAPCRSVEMSGNAPVPYL